VKQKAKLRRADFAAAHLALTGTASATSAAKFVAANDDRRPLAEE
jgi:hypothetical protein